MPLNRLLQIAGLCLSLGFGLGIVPAHAEDIHIGVSNRSLLGLPVLVAKEKGFFEKEGLTVTIDYFPGGVPATAALIGGSVQFIDAAFENNIKAVKQGQPIVSIMNLQSGFAGAVITRKDVLADRETKTGAESLKGLRIGTLARGGFADVSTRYIVKEADLDPDKDVQLIPIKGADRQIAAGEADQIDSAFVMEPWNVIAVESGTWNYAIDLTSGEGPALFNGLTYTSLQTTKDYLESNPETAEKTVRALGAALKYLVDEANIDEVARIADKEYGAPGVEIMKASLKRQAKTFTPVLTEEGAAKTAELLLESGSIEAPVPSFAETVDQRFSGLWADFAK